MDFISVVILVKVAIFMFFASAAKSKEAYVMIGLFLGVMVLETMNNPARTISYNAVIASIFILDAFLIKKINEDKDFILSGMLGIGVTSIAMMLGKAEIELPFWLTVTGYFTASVGFIYACSCSIKKMDMHEEK